MDCLGLRLAVLVTAASVQDRDAAMPLLQRLRELHRRITLVWADGGYADSSTGPAPGSASRSPSSNAPMKPRGSSSCLAASPAKPPQPGATRPRGTKQHPRHPRVWARSCFPDSRASMSPPGNARRSPALESLTPRTQLPAGTRTAALRKASPREPPRSGVPFQRAEAPPPDPGAGPRGRYRARTSARSRHPPREPLLQSLSHGVASRPERQGVDLRRRGATRRGMPLRQCTSLAAANIRPVGRTGGWRGLVSVARVGLVHADRYHEA
ncbi:hypothetical protein [Streptomyces sp. NBC_00191]|uniref:hypothetical protein n=1 Tax=Streptomyces sp. NBC_00191 TaxID=2975674 RepID=UPI003868248A